MIRSETPVAMSNSQVPWPATINALPVPGMFPAAPWLPAGQDTPRFVFVARPSNTTVSRRVTMTTLSPAHARVTGWGRGDGADALARQRRDGH